ncbi:DUF2793 domain-containing protein [Rhodoplanes serenus]|uniref:DUF2793 domain-containing protein n=1 Tax=Rhodoplanes serenus TaxID=200615 RepID=A0A9X5AT99_9BRAD|nr:DUF2793 domain-containing protein [Rhodoplanes serenus]MTW18362.1 DUF2793 domain-containing protein [Rhodoplanes serenus]
MPTPNLALPFIAQGQAQKEVTHNEALVRLDAFVHGSAKSRTLATPPGSPADGERWIVPSGATGAWAGQAGRIAHWNVNGWAFYVPLTGWRWHVEDERTMLTWSDGAWRDRVVGTANGGGIRLVAVEQELTLTGAYVETTAPTIIADRMIVLGVASRTTQAITGATSYGVGVAGNTSQFGGTLGIALGSTNIGVIGPTAFYANTPIRVTAAGGNFTGGKVRIVLYALAFAAPSS